MADIKDFGNSSGLTVFVLNEQDMIVPDLNYRPATWMVDKDGHVILYEMDPMPGEALVKCVIRQGMAPSYAAKILRKLAFLIERNGLELLNLPVGALGDFDNNGHPVEDPISGFNS